MPAITILARAGDDTFNASAGSDVISGGSGKDLINVNVVSTLASVTFVGGKWLLTGPDGLNTELTGVERIAFSDGKTFLLVAVAAN